MSKDNKAKKFLESLEIRDGKYIIKLDDPIEHGKEEIKELELVKPKAKHIRSMPSNPLTGDMLNVIGTLCAQPDSVIDELSLSDLDKATDFFEAFS